MCKKKTALYYIIFYFKVLRVILEDEKTLFVEYCPYNKTFKYLSLNVETRCLSLAVYMH